jgi:tetratricopeptide (TPR) repeat protein
MSLNTEKRKNGFLVMKNRTLQFVMLIIIAGVVSYYGCWKNQFVYDDHDLIEQNSLVREDLSLKKIFSTEYWETTRGKTTYYRPIIILSFKLDYLLFKDNPAGYHFSNMIYHILTSLLLFLLLIELQVSQSIGILASLFFVVNPIHTQSVAWISGRTDIIAAVFALVSLIFFIRFLKPLNKKTNSTLIYLIFSGFFFFIGLLSKEIVVSMPFIAIITGIYMQVNCLGKWNIKKVILCFSVFVLILILYFYLRQQIIGTVFFGNPTEESWWSFSDGNFKRFLTVPKIVSWYFLKNTIPWPLVFERGISLAAGFSDPLFYAGAMFMTVWISAIGYFYKVRNYIAAYGLLWFFISLLPISNIFPIFESAMEHFSYFPSLGYSIALGWLLSFLLVRYKKFNLGKIVVGVIFITFLLLTQIRIKDWKNDLTIYKDAVEKKPFSYRAQTQYGLTFYFKQNYNEALIHLKKAVELKPNYAQAYFNLGLVYRKLKENDQAKQIFEQAVEKNPQLIPPLNNLGIIHYERGEFSKARYYWEKILYLDPADAYAKRNLLLIKDK